MDDCAHLLVSVFNADPWNESWTFATAKKRLARILGAKGLVGFVSLDGEKILGFAAGYREQDARREVFYLDTLCVEPDAQGAGVGTRLLDRLRNELGEMDVNAIYLTTHHGIPAENFYLKNGYQVSDEDVAMFCEW